MQETRKTRHPHGGTISSLLLTELTDISRVECFCSLVPGSSILPPLKCRCDCVNVEVLKKKAKKQPCLHDTLVSPRPPFV